MYLNKFMAVEHGVSLLHINIYISICNPSLLPVLLSPPPLPSPPPLLGGPCSVQLLTLSLRSADSIFYIDAANTWAFEGRQQKAIAPCYSFVPCHNHTN